MSQYVYEVTVADIHPTLPAVEHRVRVVASTAGSARKLALRVGPSQLRVAGKPLRGTLVAQAARRIEAYR